MNDWTRDEVVRFVLCGVGMLYFAIVSVVILASIATRRTGIDQDRARHPSRAPGSSADLTTTMITSHVVSDNTASVGQSVSYDSSSSSCDGGSSSCSHH